MPDVSTNQMNVVTSTLISSGNPYPVEPLGYLLGSFFACILYGLHLSQIHHYFTTYPISKLHLFVIWIFLLSTFQVIIIFASGWHYFVDGLHDLTTVWGAFWWPLSVQEGLIPLMAFSAQLYFGRRAYILTGRRKWFGFGILVLPAITLIMGVALAVTARIWSNNPFVSIDVFKAKQIGIVATVVAISWMGLTAITDGILTVVLIRTFVRARSANPQPTINRLIRLTLETVLLTHLVGAIMCIIFLTSPSASRTNQNAFWIFLEMVTELYALSILFTINSKSASKDVERANMTYQAEGRHGGERSGADADIALRQSVLDRRVEGYQGAPLAQLTVLASGYPYYQSNHRRHGADTDRELGDDNIPGIRRDMDSDALNTTSDTGTGTGTGRTGSMRNSLSSRDIDTPDVMTPGLEVPVAYFQGGWAMFPQNSRDEKERDEIDKGL